MVLKKNNDNYQYDGYDLVMIETEDVKNIHLIEDFISKEDLEYIQEFIKNGKFVASQYDRHEFPLEGLDFTNDPHLIEMIHSYTDRIQEILEKTFECELERSEIAGLTKYAPGSQLNEHADKICVSWRDVSNVLYYNDDYTGGEIFFSQYDLVMKPKAGSLLIFPAGANYQHGVNPVKTGNRYVTSTFWKVKNWLANPYS